MKYNHICDTCYESAQLLKPQIIYICAKCKEKYIKKVMSNLSSNNYALKDIATQNYNNGRIN